jgi:hypothetical protein
MKIEMNQNYLLADYILRDCNATGVTIMDCMDEACTKNCSYSDSLEYGTCDSNTGTITKVIITQSNCVITNTTVVMV